MQELGLYVHIPFCKSKCAYCNFNSFANKFNLMEDYLISILTEIKNTSKNYKNCIVSTIYIGGGTPSTFLSGGISTIINTIKKHFNVEKNAEISIEANPNSINEQNSLEWYSCGVNRVSVGLQTTKNSLLKMLNRTHSKQDYVKAIEILKNAGFSNINTDLIICLPTQKQSHIKNAINLVNSLNCTHISTYSLILEDGTPLSDMVKNGEIKPLKEEKSVAMYNFAVNYLKKLGYEQYEVSNFAKNGFACKHNLNCWNMVPYLGFGAGAHSFTGEKRYNNFNCIETYIKNIHEKGNAIEEQEICTNNSKFEEYVMLALRTTKGLNLEHVKKTYNIDLLKQKRATIESFVNKNLLTLNNNNLCLTGSGFLVLNKIILDLVC